MVFIWVLIIMLNLVLAYIKKESKILILISLFIMSFLMSGNSDGADVVAYRLIYEQGAGKLSFLDAGYELIQNISRQYLHLGFYGFRLFVTLLSLCLIYSTIKYYGIRAHLPVALYMCYLFFMDTIQLRNFIAMAIFIFSIRYLPKDGVKNILVYVLCNLIGASIHIAFLSTLFFLIYKIRNKKLVNKMIVGMGVSSFLFFYFARSYGIKIIIFVFQLFVGQRGSGYLSTYTRYSSWGIVLLCMINMIVLYFLYFRTHYIRANIERQNYIRYLWRINCFLAIFFPMLLLNVSFYRLIRNVCVLNYIGYEILLDNYKWNSSKRVLALTGIVIVTVMWFVLDYTILNPFDSTVKPIFEHNIFLGEDKVNNLYNALFG